MARISDHGSSADVDFVADHNRSQLSFTAFVRGLVLGTGPSDRIIPVSGSSGLAAWNACTGRLQGAGVGRVSDAPADGDLLSVIHLAGRRGLPSQNCL